MAMAQFAHKPVSDGMRRPGVGDQLAEQGTEDEQGEKLDHIQPQLFHEQLGIGGHDIGGGAAEQNRQGGHQRCQDQHRHAPIGEKHQQQKGYQYRHRAHG